MDYPGNGGLPPDVRAAPAHVDRVPPLTRDAWLPSVLFSIAAAGKIPIGQHPIGWVDRRVGTWVHVLLVELSSQF